MITITFVDDERELTKSFQVENIADLLDATKLPVFQKEKGVRIPIAWMVLQVAKQMDKKDKEELDNHIDVWYIKTMSKTTDIVKSKRKPPVREYPIHNDPKKQAFLAYYYEPMSPTYANVYRSGLRAGFSEQYCRIMKSPSIGNKWIKLENYVGKSELTPEHIIGGIERVALKGMQEKDKLKALELLAKLKGMLVDRSVTAHVNIEQALSELKWESRP